MIDEVKKQLEAYMEAEIIKAKLKALEAQEKVVKKQLYEKLNQIPNLPAPDVEISKGKTWNIK